VLGSTFDWRVGVAPLEPLSQPRRTQSTRRPEQFRVCRFTASGPLCLCVLRVLRGWTLQGHEIELRDESELCWVFLGGGFRLKPVLQRFVPRWTGYEAFSGMLCVGWAKPSQARGDPPIRPAPDRDPGGGKTTRWVRSVRVRRSLVPLKLRRGNPIGEALPASRSGFPA
jgi:hypothetical protein